MIDWMSLPPLAALRAFAAYAETGNITKAGARLNVSHAAVSQQIRALEAHMGVALFDRTGRRLRMTAEGERLARALQQGFEGIAQTIDEMTGVEAERPLLVSATPTLASAWLVPRLPDFRAKHPGIDLMIDASAEVREIGPGGVDLSIRYGNGEWRGLETDLLLPSPVVVVGAASLYNGPTPCEIEALGEFPWLQEIGTNEASAFLSRHGASGELTHGTTSLPGNMMLEAVRAGQGLAAVALVTVEADIAAGRLNILCRDDRAQGYFIVTRPGVQRPPVREFVRWLRRQGRQSVTK
ncbi:LysR family transcriptional regulator [Alisedimentitalea sp. MJ-SS2]|uniref:LysR family transcriptional regulator n=1 Tax=Aliisedimentitalea sp. MJ-SS2 TaxID=3049795 RepID=UPI0029134F9B|nr:LysR family transcriptional regulator [Alisedimentitalea sp. MJ-SS2]MDU8928122.1 LysR family transcriptional regulator [Alisedimentitalea sp. MJ-SS2]